MASDRWTSTTFRVVSNSLIVVLRSSSRIRIQSSVVLVLVYLHVDNRSSLEAGAQKKFSSFTTHFNHLLFLHGALLLPPIRDANTNLDAVLSHRVGAWEEGGDTGLSEIAETRRYGHLSTYNQVATLLSTSQTSRLTALEFLRKIISNGAWPIYRSGGPLYRTRPLNSWRQQYQHCQNFEKVLERPNKVIPTICGL